MDRELDTFLKECKLAGFKVEGSDRERTFLVEQYVLVGQYDVWSNSWIALHCDVDGTWASWGHNFQDQFSSLNEVLTFAYEKIEGWNE